MEIRVEVRAGARREGIEPTARGFAIAVREKAEHNLANERVRALLALHFRIPAASVHLIRGHHSSRKTFSIKT